MQIRLTLPNGEETTSHVADGAPLGEFLHFSGLNPNKNQIFLNGSLVTSYDQILRDMDRVRVASKNYTSGMAA